MIAWRVDQVEMVTPSRINRSGLAPGQKAPDFTLPSVGDRPESLHEFAGRTVLLVFTKSGCGPCHAIAPELNRLQEKHDLDVLVVNNGTIEETRAWAAEVKARFRVLAQEKLAVSKQYEVFATPFGFLIDEQGIVRSKGIVGSRQYLDYVVNGAGHGRREEEVPYVRHNRSGRGTLRDERLTA